MDLEQAVIDEIRDWSKHALESANPFFNNLPACPYARNAWSMEKVGFVFNYGSDKDSLYDLASRFPDQYDVVLLIDFVFPEDTEDFHDYLDTFNDAVANGVFLDRDIWVMGFHPDDDAQEEAFDQESFDHLVDDLYTITFVQRLTKLEKAAEILRKKGYYDAYMKDPQYKDLWTRRKTLHRRLKNARN